MKNRPMFFFAAPGEAAGASGSSAVASTITPAGGDDGTIDPLTYQPPETEEISKFLANPGGENDPGPVGKVKKPDEPAPGKQPELKPGQQPAKKPEGQQPPPAKPGEAEPPASQLRARLKELEGERDSLKGQLETAKTDRRVDELTAKIGEKDKAIAAAEKSRAEYEQKLLVHNPLVSKRLVDMREAFNKEYATAVEMVPGMAGDYRGLLSEFQALPRGTDGYPAALKEFKERLRDKFDDDMPTVFEALRKGNAFTIEHARAADEIQRDAAKIDFEGRQKSWQESHSGIEKEWDSYFAPPTDAAANDPYNPSLFLQEFEKVMPKEEVDRINAGLRGYVSRIFNGPQPRTKGDFPGLSDEAAHAEMAKIAERSDAERQEAKRVVSVALKFVTLARPIIADWQKLRQRLGDSAGAQPPDPTNQSGVAAAAAGADDMDVNIPSPEDIAASLR